MRYEILGVLPTLNEHDKANRTNRFVGAKMKQEATDLVALQLMGKQKITKPCYISFHWFVSSRADFDNIAFGKKYILDGMVKAGVLADDNQKHVLGFRGDYFSKVSKGQEKIQIFVEK